jgi:hypothetical protein
VVDGEPTRLAVLVFVQQILGGSMLDQFKNVTRKRGKALLAALVLSSGPSPAVTRTSHGGALQRTAAITVKQPPPPLHLENLPMASPDDWRPRKRNHFLGFITLLLYLGALSLLVLQATSLLRQWDFRIGDTPPSFNSTGPTIVQLERLQYVVSIRVHVADVLVGESRWLEGSWIIQGDALLAVDMAKAEIKDRNEQAKTAIIVLPQPAILSGRVNHQKTQEWDIKARSWIPLASMILGDRTAMEKQAMLRAQQLVERASGSDDNKAAARQGVEGMLSEFYRAVGWHISVQWK